ncbi:MAG TPA: PadR family transcriptional regulator [Ruminococcaceae bacterium]|nr:PadR family transcriptional regulator [Oscillospiraceae bacterium]
MVFPVGAALLDALVLSVVEGEDTYGYKITQQVRQAIELSESTLYPVLRRLQKDDYLATYDKEYLGRNRRYYKVTPKGIQQLYLYREEWLKYKRRVDKVLMEGETE